LLSLGQTIEDEGVFETVKIIWNILTHPNLRQKIAKMRRDFQQHQNHLGYIVFFASPL